VSAFAKTANQPKTIPLHCTGEVRVMDDVELAAHLDTAKATKNTITWCERLIEHPIARKKTSVLPLTIRSTLFSTLTYHSP
jgi:hypothetical protein